MIKKLFILISLLFCSFCYEAFAQESLPPYLNMKIENGIFSPLLKSVKGVIFIPEIKNVARIRQWNLSIKNEDGKEVMSFSGARKVPSEFVWDALLKKNTPVKDGLYSYEFTIALNSKENISVKKSNILIDTIAPFISLSLSEDVFFISRSDNKAQNPQELIIFMSCGDEGGIDFSKTILEIVNSQNNAVKTYRFEDTIPDFAVWNADNDKGEILPDGNYNAVFSAFDLAGNKAQVLVEISLLSLQEEEENGLINDLKQTVYFNSNKSNLTSQSVKTLQYIAEILIENKKNSVLITGHTDGSKTETNSKNLSQNRAKAVYDFLIEAGIDSSRIRTEALGNRQLAVSPKVKGANEKNRRAEITILKME